MLRRLLPALLLAALTACAVQPLASPPTSTALPPTEAPAPSPTQTAAAAALPQTSLQNGVVQIYVDINHPLQTLGSVAGGNFVHQISQTMTALEPVAEYNLKSLKVGAARVRIALEEWEPRNDNDDPARANLEAFSDTGANHATFLFLQEMHTRGALLIATVWDIPGWLSNNPDAEKNKYLPPDRYPEAVESIGQWLVTARDVYGVEVDFVSFNEPDVGANVSMMGREYAALVAQAGPRFAQLGLKTRWLLADTANMSNGLGMARAAWSKPELRPSLGPIAVHSWDADAPDTTLLALRDYAAAQGLEVWCTEAGWAPFLWQTPEQFTEWPHALNLARIYSRLLKLAGATNILYWEMLGFDYQLNDGTSPYPAFEILRQLSDHLPAGSTILDTSANTETLFFFTAQASRQHIVYLVNMASDPQTVAIHGLPDGSYAREASTANAVGSDGGAVEVKAGTLTLELPPQSVVILFESEE